MIRKIPLIRESPIDVPHSHDDVVVLLYQFLAQTVADGIVGFHDERDSPLLVAQHQIVFDVPIDPVEKTGESLHVTDFQVQRL